MATDSRVLSMLIQVCSAFFERLDRRVLVSRILDTAIELTHGDRGSVFLAPEHSHRLTSFVATGLGGQELEVDISQGVAGEVFRSGLPLIINDAQRDPRFYGRVDELTHYHTETILTVPLRTPGGRTLGVIEILNSKRGQFEEEDQQILQVLALFAAVALQQRTEIDSLTEANEKLKQERREWISRSGEKFVLASTNGRLQELYEKLSVFARSDSSILIEGESGTGKEIIARVIHVKSNRVDRPFIALNCAAIPESLFEAELFGVAKGAATGTAERRGKVELAQGGTLFLDEIGELPLSIQAKLLRVLQDKTVTRVGSEDAPKTVDFRVIAATNRDLAAMVREGKFREDLFYRINVVQFRLPPLRDRPGDIPALCESILRTFELERGWKRKRLDAGALALFQSFAWPGNIRQLQNKLESAMIVSGARETLEARDFQLEDSASRAKAPASDTGTGSGAGSGAGWSGERIGDPGQSGDVPLNLKAAKDELEKNLILKALARTEGNKSRAAALLGITREGLRRAMIRYGLAGQ